MGLCMPSGDNNDDRSFGRGVESEFDEIESGDDEKAELASDVIINNAPEELEQHSEGW